MPALSTPIEKIVLPPSQTRLLYRFEAQLQSVARGVVPEGLRMANSFEGRVTEGAFLDGRVWGIDHFLLRTDGVGVIDAEKTISAGDRHHYGHVRGYCLPPEGMEMPSLEAVLDPDFRWPDVPFPIVGFSMFRSADPEYAYLNRAIAMIQGSASFVTGQLTIETRLIEHANRTR